MAKNVVIGLRELPFDLVESAMDNTPLPMENTVVVPGYDLQDALG